MVRRSSASAASSASKFSFCARRLQFALGGLGLPLDAVKLAGPVDQGRDGLFKRVFGGDKLLHARRLRPGQFSLAPR